MLKRWFSSSRRVLSLRESEAIFTPYELRFVFPVYSTCLYKFIYSFTLIPGGFYIFHFRWFTSFPLVSSVIKFHRCISVCLISSCLCFSWASHNSAWFFKLVGWKNFFTRNPPALAPIRPWKPPTPDIL